MPGLVLPVLCLLVASVLPAAAAGCLPGATGPPLVVLEVFPADGGSLPAGEPVVLRFNLPFDEQSLAQRLKVQPPRELQLTREGSVALVLLKDASPGQVYTVSVVAGVRGFSGERLMDGCGVSFYVTPPGQPGGGEEPSPGGGTVSPAGNVPQVGGLRLSLDGKSVFACDLPGAYQVPHFDHVRLYLAKPLSAEQAARFAVLEVDARGRLRRVRTTVESRGGSVDLELEEETLAGLSYELQWLSGAGPVPSEPAAADPLFTWTVTGTPCVFVWSLRPSTAKVAPVGRLDLGFEISQLAGGTGGRLLAVGNPGGAEWQGLELVQAIDFGLLPVGPPVAAYGYVNHLPAQTQAETGIVVVSGPASGVSPLVGEGKWEGYLPGPGTSSGGGPGLGGTRRPGDPGGPGTPIDPQDEPALIALTARGPVTLIRGTDVGAKFLSGGALSPDGCALIFVSHDFSEGTLVRLWRLDLPRGWEQDGLEGADLLPREIARALYPEEPGSQFTYGGGAIWGQGGDCIWWDICIAEGQAEIWRVDPSTGQRELFAQEAAMPLESPDGAMLFCRTSSGGSIFTAGGALVRTVRQDFTWACWTPDSSSLLLVSGQGISCAPLEGAIRQLAGFRAGPGGFVDPDEFWFVSDRRF